MVHQCLISSTSWTLESHMEKSLEATQRNLNTIRTGRANPNLLDKVMVEYYRL